MTNVVWCSRGGLARGGRACASMHELEAGEILWRHTGQGIKIWSSSVQDPDVVNIVNAAFVKLECGFVGEVAVKSSVKAIRYPSVGAIADELIVACTTNESRDPVCTLDVRRELRVDIRWGFGSVVPFGFMPAP